MINDQYHVTTEDGKVRRIEVTTEGGKIRRIEVPSSDIEVSDGHHTFGELYDHRRALTALLAAMAATADEAWRSKQHHPDDDPMFEGGYFIVGINLPAGPITYHYKMSHWDDFSSVPELDHAPKWDGAAPSATINRLMDAVRIIAQDED